MAEDTAAAATDASVLEAAASLAVEEHEGDAIQEEEEEEEQGGEEEEEEEEEAAEAGKPYPYTEALAAQQRVYIDETRHDKPFPPPSFFHDPDDDSDKRTTVDAKGRPFPPPTQRTPFLAPDAAQRYHTHHAMPLHHLNREIGALSRGQRTWRKDRRSPWAWRNGPEGYRAMQFQDFWFCDDVFVGDDREEEWSVEAKKMVGE